MTATAASTRNVTVSIQEPGFGAALRAEWTRLRSVRSTWIVVSLAIVLSIGFSALIALVSGLTHESWNEDVRAAFDPVLTTNSGSLFGCITLIVLAVTAVTSEYSSGMIRTTFTTNPRRTQVFAARTTMVALFGMGIALATIPVMFLVSQPIFGHYGLETASITDGDTFRTVMTITLTQGLIYTMIPLSIAWLLRGAASAITASLGFLWLPWMLGPVLPDWVKENVVRYLPDVAANSLSGINASDTPQYLSQTPAIIVVCAWLIGSLAVAAIAINRRDV